MRIDSKVAFNDDLFDGLAARTLCPFCRRKSLHVSSQGERRELLEKSDEEERSLVVGELEKNGCQYEYCERAAGGPVARDRSWGLR
jgi:hypothetical protein